jgi:Glycosyltransferase WbsX
MQQSRFSVPDTFVSAQRVLTVNSWNEWTEGSYIEPDTVHGTKYLEAIRDVFGRKPES